jgi:hypothetical protein
MISPEPDGTNETNPSGLVGKTSFPSLPSVQRSAGHPPAAWRCFTRDYHMGLGIIIPGDNSRLLAATKKISPSILNDELKN